MDKKDMQKIIKEFFTKFAKNNNFVFNKPTLLIRIHRDTLHIINFDVLKKGFNCNIAIQPLYIPSDTIILSFGNRINHFRTRISGTWGYGDTKQEVEKDLSQVKELLESNVLPWFSEIGFPEGIIKFIESGSMESNSLIVGFPPVLKSKYLGFSYLYINKYQQAIRLLQDVIEKRKEDNWDWVLKENKIIRNIIAFVESEPDKVKQKINEFVTQTKVSLKLKA